MAARRHLWVSRLRLVVREHGVRVVWSALFDDLLASGMHWRTALPISRRRAALAIWLMKGLAQADAAARLGVSLRTVGTDAQALRRVLNAQELGEPSSAPIGRVPAMPDEVPMELRRRRR